MCDWTARAPLWQTLQVGDSNRSSRGFPLSASKAVFSVSTLFSSVTFPDSGALLVDCSDPEHPASKSAEKGVTTSHARIAERVSGSTPTGYPASPAADVSRSNEHGPRPHRLGGVERPAAGRGRLTGSASSRPYGYWFRHRPAIGARERAPRCTSRSDRAPTRLRPGEARRSGCRRT